MYFLVAKILDIELNFENKGTKLLRIYQRELNDCFRACAASVLELPIESLPNYKAGINTQRILSKNSRWSIWCKRNGYELVKQLFPLDHQLPVDSYYIANFKYRSKNWAHAMVCRNNVLVHDPAWQHRDFTQQTYESMFYSIPYSIIQFKEVR